MKSRRFITVLGAAGVIAGTAVSPGISAVQNLGSESSEALEQILQESPTSAEAAAAFDLLAARFKDRDDHGRPDVFGPPGRPDIGPPGHYTG